MSIGMSSDQPQSLGINAAKVENRCRFGLYRLELRVLL